MVFFFFVFRAVAKKKFNVHLGQKVRLFQVSATPRLENPDSDKKDADKNEF
jgi:hypothetical protein